MTDTNKEKLIKKIQNNPDLILKDPNKLKSVACDPKLASELVKAKNRTELLISIDGNNFKLKRSVNYDSSILNKLQLPH